MKLDRSECGRKFLLGFKEHYGTTSNNYNISLQKVTMGYSTY